MGQKGIRKGQIGIWMDTWQRGKQKEGEREEKDGWMDRQMVEMVGR